MTISHSRIWLSSLLVFLVAVRKAGSRFKKQCFCSVRLVVQQVLGLLAVFQLFCFSSCIQVISAAEPAAALPADTEHYTYKKAHDRNGIGKFYRGREIARVMSYHGADWLERESREEEEKLSLLIKSLKLEPGMIVADIGAGTGVISVLMAEQVGPKGKVLAVDIQQEMLDLLEEKTKQLGIQNIKPVKGTVKSPKLPAETVDLAIFVDVYHEMAFPYEMMSALSKSMKPGGQIVLVEYRKEDPSVPIKLLHKMSQKQVKKELLQPEFSLKWKKTINVLPRQHILIFEKQAAGDKAK